MSCAAYNAARSLLAATPFRCNAMPLIASVWRGRSLAPDKISLSVQIANQNLTTSQHSTDDRAASAAANQIGIAIG